MRAEPAERYASAAAFEADIRRYMDSRPGAGANRALASSRQPVVAKPLGGGDLCCRDRAGRGSADDHADARPVGGRRPRRRSFPSPACRVRRASRTSRRTGRSWCTFGVGRTGRTRTYTCSPWTNGSVRRFTTDPANDLSPVWSPDGSRIAWLRTGRGETAVFVASVAGGNPSQDRGCISDPRGSGGTRAGLVSRRPNTWRCRTNRRPKSRSTSS